MKNVLEWLEETAQRLPEKTAFLDEKEKISFQETLDLSRQTGAGLLDVLKKTNVPAAVLSGRSVRTPVLFLGCVYAGCFYAPLDPTAPAERLRVILTNLRPEVLIVSEEYQKLAEKLTEGLSPIPVLSAEKLTATPVTEEKRRQFQTIREAMEPADPLYVIHTSGSSGIPKGVLTGHASLINYIEAYAEVMGIEETDVFGNQSPLDYIAAIRDIYLPLKTGASTYIIPKKSFAVPALLFDDLSDRKVTAIGWSVNAITIPTNMGAFEKGRPEYLKKICFSGSVMPCRVLKIWQENLPDAKFVNQYGPTEATASCTFYEITDRVKEDDVLPIGKPYKNYEVFLLNEDGTLTEDGQIGEICVGGPVLALGYYNDPERTALSFVKDPRKGEGIIYKTGDLGRMAPDGNLEFHGRKDRQIKYLGHRVELGEIEEAAKQVPGVSDAAALYKEEAEQIFLAYTGPATVKEIAVELRKSLPGFMVPRKFLNLEELPHLPNGKTDYQTLQKKI